MSKIYDKTVVKLIEDTENGKISWMCVIPGYQGKGDNYIWLIDTQRDVLEYKRIPLSLSSNDLLRHLKNTIEDSLDREEREREERILSELELAPRNKKWWQVWG